MKKVITFIITVLYFFCNPNSTVIASNLNSINTYTSTEKYNVKMKQDILCFMMAYPQYIIGVKREDSGLVYLVMKSGKKILYDDKKIKSFEEKLVNSDLQDVMEQIYPLSPVTKLTDKNFDPGRLRNYQLLTEAYGNSKNQVQSNLKRVNLGYNNLLFNGNNKAVESLQSALEELIPMAKHKQNIASCLFPCSGTFNYRVIAGTNRLSPHAFGIAIDFARDRRDYWRWASPEEGEKRLLSYPQEMVAILEKNNFVWGGKWNHFDTLHFEYRPEIIMKAKYFSGENIDKEEWYLDVPKNDTLIKNFIETINEALK